METRSIKLRIDDSGAKTKYSWETMADIWGEDKYSSALISN